MNGRVIAVDDASMTGRHGLGSTGRCKTAMDGVEANKMQQYRK